MYSYAKLFRRGKWSADNLKRIVIIVPSNDDNFTTDYSSRVLVLKIIRAIEETKMIPLDRFSFTSHS